MIRAMLFVLGLIFIAALVIFGWTLALLSPGVRDIIDALQF